MSQIKEDVLREVREEFAEMQAASDIILNRGVGLHWNGERIELIHIEKPEQPDSSLYYIELPEDDWTVPTNKLLRLAMGEIVNGLDDYISQLTDDSNPDNPPKIEFPEDEDSITDIGRRGGQATAKKYGKEYMAKLSKKGGQANKKKWEEKAGK